MRKIYVSTILSKLVNFASFDNLLSSELATLLSGRYIEISILPFSFTEYLEVREIDMSNKYLNYEAFFYDYVNETSLPQGIKLREEGFDKIYKYLEALYATIIEKDITQRYKINDKRAFGNVAKFVAARLPCRQVPLNDVYTIYMNCAKCATQNAQLSQRVPWYGFFSHEKRYFLYHRLCTTSSRSILSFFVSVKKLIIQLSRVVLRVINW